jgi:uncharacterized protein (TIGR02145 family)
MTINNRTLRALFLASTLCLLLPGCAEKTAPKTFGTLADERDGKTYRTVKMPDGKMWMGENLNIKTDGSWCYDNKKSSCDKYGRLYNWNAAMRACPSGWHLPSRQEWDNLSQAVGGIRGPDDEGDIGWFGAGEKLKAKNGWYNDGNGTDEYGFSALPGGSRITDSYFIAGYFGDWWTATGSGSGNAYHRYMNGNHDDVYEAETDVSNGLSVRCVGE